MTETALAATSAPVLSTSGGSLTWQSLAGVSSYRLATVSNPTTTRNTTYQTVTGTSFKPPAVAGQTVNYGLAANVAGAPWSREVTINWPAALPTAPVITVSGSTLSWPALAGVSSYQLAVILNPRTTRNTTYQTVTGTSFTPPVLAGQTVNYGMLANVAGAPWATEVAVTYPAAVPVTPAAPVLTVASGTLHWTAMAGVGTYQLATVLNPTTTRNTTYQMVTGTSYTPPPVAGQSVNYGLQADVANAPWSSEVTITSPVSSLPVAGQKLVVSVMNTTGWGVDSIFADAGINATRLDIGEGAGIGLLKTAIANGMHPLPVYTEGSDGNLTGLTSAQCAADIKAIVPQLQALGITTLEFGNESYLTESAAIYGAQYNAAHIAAQGSGVKLLAAATTDNYEHDRGGTGSWFSDLVKALPGGAGEIDALTLHPYGSMTSVGSDGYGWPMVPTLHSEAVAAGISPTLPWYFTEAGQEVSGGGIEGQAPVSQSTQASDATQYLNDIKTKYTWVVYIDWYTCRDDSSGGFGLLNSDNTPRPAFTAIQNWITANPAITNG